MKQAFSRFRIARIDFLYLKLDKIALVPPVTYAEGGTAPHNEKMKIFSNGPPPMFFPNFFQKF